MSEEIVIREGRCLCGAVRFKATGEPINVRICHCRNCQKAMGSPFYARALYPQTAIAVEGDTGSYASSGTDRPGVLQACGDPLFSWRREMAAGVALAVFDDSHAFVPTEHIWVSEKSIGSKRRPTAISGKSRLRCLAPKPIGLDISQVRGDRIVILTGHRLLQHNLYSISVWILPLVIAITFHEAAHGFVAHHFGDNTAGNAAASVQSPKHIDPFGTLLLPAILLFSHSPFLFGYAKPVPVNFRALRNPRIDMVWVALAGPATNIALALVAAAAFICCLLRPKARRNGSPTI